MGQIIKNGISYVGGGGASVTPVEVIDEHSTAAQIPSAKAVYDLFKTITPGSDIPDGEGTKF